MAKRPRKFLRYAVAGAIVFSFLVAGLFVVLGLEDWNQRMEPAQSDLGRLAEKILPKDIAERIRRGAVDEPRPPDVKSIESRTDGLADFDPIDDESLRSLSAQTRETLQTRYNLGLVKYYDGDTVGAIRAFRSVLDLDAQSVYGRRSFIQLGLIRDQAGMHDEAIEAFKNAVNLDPRDAVAAHNLGMAHFHAGNPGEAVRWLEKAAQLDAANSRFLQNLGNAWLASDNPERAEQAYREAIKLDPKNAEAHFNLGIQLHNSDRYEEAAGHLAAAADGLSGDAKARAYSFHGLTQYKRGLFGDAAESYRKAYQVKPDVDHLFNRAVALAKSGLRDEAVKGFEQVVTAQPNDSHAWFGLGGAHYLSNQLDQALKAYEQGLRIAPNASGPLFTVGYILYQKGELDRAERAFERVIALGGEDAARARVNLGLIHEARGKVPDAISQYERGDPTDARTFYNLGLARRRISDHAGAVEAFQRAVELNPNEARYKIALAESYQEIRRPEAALASFEEALKTGGDDFAVLIRLAKLATRLERRQDAREWIARALVVAERGEEKAQAWLAKAIYEGAVGDLDAALSALEEARKADPNNADVYYNLGVLYARQLRYDAAVDALQVAIRLRPDYASAYTQLGNIYYRRGLNGEAARAYERAVELDSAAIDAAFNLSQVRSE